ncbi:hypothetical protein EGI22_22000 [Lacihabitans sp. LS3-19]|uniref:LysE family translocator n=1 Tax=Lacihabitans sp. LS3-19 TaxID=2487335 RepID=UPI0020CD381C|nr:LysE family transporter [Lacihabitans sp. LS3-19]MCP9770590.1 hypothetical protein [Lacihabitans sp. LS3-19]
MFETLANGILIGLGSAFLIGPVFISIVNASIQNGFSVAKYLALGVAISDLLYIVLASIFTDIILKNEYYEKYSQSFKIIFLLAYGIYLLLKKVVVEEQNTNYKSSNQKLKNITKGILINGLNPGVLIFWFGIISAFSSQYIGNPERKLILLIFIILTTFSMDLFKIKLAAKFSSRLNIKSIKVINRFIGIAFLITALALIFKNT